MGKLALHYYRPDFTAEQVKMLMGDYLDDLEKYDSADVAYACEQYRKKADSQFFPKIGQIIELLTPKKYKWESRESHLPRIGRGEFLQLEAKRAVKSVSEVLRQNGFGHAAENWDAWKEARPK